MENAQGIPTEQVLLEEYRQAMENQRSNTNIAYSWVGNIFLVLSITLFYHGTTIEKIGKLIPTMMLAITLACI